jgi:hypothetical protein
MEIRQGFMDRSRALFSMKLIYFEDSFKVRYHFFLWKLTNH